MYLFFLYLKYFNQNILRNFYTNFNYVVKFENQFILDKFLCLIIYTAIYCKIRSIKRFNIYADATEK